jgi:hypothetical protein
MASLTSVGVPDFAERVVQEAFAPNDFDLRLRRLDDLQAPI